MSLDVLTTLTLLAKFCLYLGALVSIGLISHHLLKIRGNLKGLTLGFLLIVIGLVMKLLTANAQLGGGLSHALNFDSFHWVWQSSQAQAGFLVTGITMALISCRLKVSLLKTTGLVTAILCLSLSFAMTGHTQGQEDAPLLYLWILPHLLMAGFWVMAPVSLWPDRQSNDQGLIDNVERFSRGAIWIVPLLFLTGGYVLWRLLPQISDLRTTLYGQLLSVKLVAVTGLLALGAWNRFRVTRMLKDDIVAGRRQLKRSLAFEAVLFALVIVAILFATTVTGPGNHSH